MNIQPSHRLVAAAERAGQWSGMRGWPLERRFWASTDKRGPDECWNWIAYTKGGYGAIRVGGRQKSAHRVSWELHNGSIGKGLWVLHRCDNPRCVNPAHLFLGTQVDNMRDMAAKARNKPPRLHGTRNPMAKLTDEQCEAIRTAEGTQDEIAARFGTSQSHVSSIRSGRYRRPA